MTDHVILGKGRIGSTVARILAGRGERVRVLSRSGGAEAALAEAVEWWRRRLVAA